MNIRRLAVVTSICCIAGCKNHDGTFEPDCIAYEGERFELLDGRYSWQYFTDQRLIGDDGNPVESHPEYPKSGAYRVSENQLTLLSKDGNAIAERYLYEHQEEIYLLTPEQYEAVSNGQTMPDCALRRSTESR